MLHKKLLAGMLSGVLFLHLMSCKKKEDVGMPPPVLSNLKGTAGYGEAVFTWDPIGRTPKDSADYLYTSISYTDSTGKINETKFSRYTDTAVVGSLIDRPYTFTIKTVGPLGAVGVPAMLSLTPKPPVYIAIANTLKIEASIGGAKISWDNNSGKTVIVNAAYTDPTTNKVMSKSFTSAQQAGVGFLSGIPGGSPVTVVVTVTDISRRQSNPVTATVTPLTEVKISRAGWSIAGFSDQEDGGEGPVNGYATAAIDGNINTFWHTTWSSAETPYPHWIAVNIGRSVTISRVGLVNRQGHKDGQTEIQLMGSTDGQNWTDLGTYPFQQKNEEQFFPVPPQQWNYVKVVLTKGPNFFGFLAEINLYGAL
ncbi:MAG: discoidin domain-containing protein [Chitinophaga sp.]|uniref:discoidin domain-containing protein n=1 Tax=Chitinophaga sp. TaxID=1869181 RepID=UPI0025B861F2|nr:discoidin domain-containing protein [Chitinophaga sp.]MBV8251431.1 discoidin domain-containing protein [Chitinophaga sp.]